MVKTKVERLSDRKIREQSLHHTKYVGMDGVAVPSVTQVLGSCSGVGGLVAWGNRLGFEGIDSDEYRRNAAIVGTSIHARVHAFLTGTIWLDESLPPAFVPLVDNGFASFMSWWTDTGLDLADVHFSELKMSPQEMGIDLPYGGTADLGVFIGGRLVLVDLKSGTHIGDEVWCQLEAYGHAYDQLAALTAGRPVERIAYLQVSKDHVGYTYNPRERDPLAWDEFCLCLALHNKRAERRKAK